MPSAPLPIPSVLRVEPTATPAAPAVTPTSEPSATATPFGERWRFADNRRRACFAGHVPDYDRGEWRHWIDADRDCQDARQEALIAESLSSVTYEAQDQCRVESGDWFGAYTGESFTDPGDLDVDHMVPLENAHRSGGWAWSKERKADYANDLTYANHLIAVQASANRQKGSKGPEEWKPPRREYWCEYATDWVTIKHGWGLTANPSEADALREMLATCEEPITLVTVPIDGAVLPSSTSGIHLRRLRRRWLTVHCATTRTGLTATAATSTHGTRRRHSTSRRAGRTATGTGSMGTATGWRALR